MQLSIKRKYWVLVQLIIILVIGQSVVVVAEQQVVDHKTYNILYINSYHEGYKWSDDIKTTMEATFSDAIIQIEVDYFYLDTQRMPEKNPVGYFEDLASSLAYKSKYRHYDAIITSDDAAYNFVVDHGEIFDYDIPHMFCGVNDSEKVQQVHQRPTGGVLEYLDIAQTLDLIQSLHSNVNNVYYLADSSLTGKATETTFLEVAKDYEDAYKFISIEGKDINETLQNVALLEDDAVVFYIMHYYDQVGNYFNYDEGIRLVSDASKVPVYTLWEFYLGNGIMGGKLASGEIQGEKVANMVIRYFTDESYQLAITSDNENEYMFDFQQLKHFDINLDQLPQSSNVINFSPIDQKDILVLHSYDSGFQWTKNIGEGILEGLKTYDGEYEVYTEFMDLKRINNPIYLYNFQQTFDEKYRNREFDLVITSDDGAFNYAMAHIQPNYGQVPIVFSGVNYLSQERIVEHPTYTGVMEAYDVKGTIDAIRKLQPDVTNLYVINDMTTTGQGNQINVQNIAGAYEGQLTFEYTANLTMNELLTDVGQLDKSTAILLMSFNQDRANNNYSYAQSIALISEATKVPMYGVWDFYLGDGIVGGFLTDGFEQGFQAGLMGVSVLYGNDVGKIPIMTSSPNDYAFDAAQLSKFRLDQNLLPEGSRVINGEETFWDTYRENSQFFNFIFLLLMLTVVIIVILLQTLRNTVKMNAEINRLATYDHLTGILNRGSGIKALERFITDPSNLHKEMTICFMDLNGLKAVNDEFGHAEGDHFIHKIVDVINKLIRPVDIFCRMGGDEFMVILTDVDPSEGPKFVQQVKGVLIDISKLHQKPYDYSLSIGINHLVVEKDINITDVIERADTLMYRDKAIYRKSKRT